MKVVPCIAWVKRGVPVPVPKKIKLSKEELRQLLQGATAETSDSDAPQPHALGGSKARDKEEVDSEDDGNEATDPDKRYGLDKYDEEDASASDRHLKGLAVFASNEDDPFIATHDSDEDDDDFQLKPDDNLFLLGRVDDDEYQLEVHVYNESESSFYIHHDYPLDCPPICIESINYDPGSDGEGGNLCAIGGLDPVIQLWDLDIVGSMEPVAVLGGTAKEKKKKKAKTQEEGETSGEQTRKKRKTIRHSDAVLDLAWNRLRPHVLASCSADNSVILWDIETGQGANVMNNHSDKVQGIQWHPVEDNLLLSGGCDGLVTLWDCRTCSSQRQWQLPVGEVEKVRWNQWDPFRFLVISDTGDLYSLDSRQNEVTSEACFNDAHSGAISGLAIHSVASECLATCGVDGIVKIWRIERAGEKPARLVTRKKLKMGKLFSCSFCPDNPWLLGIGGESEEGVYLWDIRNDQKVVNEWAVSGLDSGSLFETVDDNNLTEGDSES